MMNRYYIVFSLAGKDICGCWRQAKDEEIAIMDAEFALEFQHPDTEYDKARIIRREED